MILEPNTFFLVAGSAEGDSPLTAFDAALLAAGVGDVNLIKLSSILPPHCTQIDPLRLPPGSLVPCAYASMSFGDPLRIISAAVGVGVPEDPNEAGLIMEYHAAHTNADHAARAVRGMVAEGMARRNRPVKDILVASVDRAVGKRHVAVFAGVILWDSNL